MPPLRRYAPLAMLLCLLHRTGLGYKYPQSTVQQSNFKEPIPMKRILFCLALLLAFTCVSTSSAHAYPDWQGTVASRNAACYLTVKHNDVVIGWKKFQVAYNLENEAVQIQIQCEYPGTDFGRFQCRVTQYNAKEFTFKNPTVVYQLLPGTANAKAHACSKIISKVGIGVVSSPSYHE